MYTVLERERQLLLEGEFFNCFNFEALTQLDHLKEDFTALAYRV